MLHILFLAAAFISFAVPTMAQQGGLPAVQAQINVLQAQNASLQQQINSLKTSLGTLQTEIDNLTSAVADDDGTAQALVGTWTGSVRSLQFDKTGHVTSPN